MEEKIKEQKKEQPCSPLERRYGRISIADSMLRKLDPGPLRALFSVFYPVKVEFDFLTIHHVYYGFSQGFRELNPGEKPPMYEVIFEGTQDSTNPHQYNYVAVLREIK